MNAGESIVGFTAFLPNEHRLWRFSDSTFHRECFNRWSDHSYFLSLYQQWKEIMDSRPEVLGTLEEMQKWQEEAFRVFSDCS